MSSHRPTDREVTKYRSSPTHLRQCFSMASVESMTVPSMSIKKPSKTCLDAGAEKLPSSGDGVGGGIDEVLCFAFHARAEQLKDGLICNNNLSERLKKSQRRQWYSHPPPEVLRSTQKPSELLSNSGRLTGRRLVSSTLLSRAAGDVTFGKLSKVACEGCGEEKLHDLLAQHFVTHASFDLP